MADPSSDRDRRERAAASVLRRLSAEGLGVALPEAVDRRVQAARRRLVDPSREPPPHLLPLAGLAALALGWFEGARGFLAAAVEDPPARSSPVPRPRALVLLAARYALWSGDLRTLASLAPALEPWVAAAREDGRDGALPDLVRSLEPGGASPALDRLRDAAGAAPSTGPQAMGWSDCLRELSFGGGPHPERLVGPGALARFLREEPADGDGDLLVPLALVRGLLAAEADAGYGRLVLAPRPPRGWSRLEVRGLCLGDAAVALDYRGGPTAHRFLLRQDRGRVPLNLVFAPEVPWPGGEPPGGPGQGRTGVRLNGEEADAEVTAAGPRVRVRLQVPLDRETEIEVG